MKVLRRGKEKKQQAMIDAWGVVNAAAPNEVLGWLHRGIQEAFRETNLRRALVNALNSLEKSQPEKYGQLVKDCKAEMKRLSEEKPAVGEAEEKESDDET